MPHGHNVFHSSINHVNVFSQQDSVMMHFVFDYALVTNLGEKYFEPDHNPINPITLNRDVDGIPVAATGPNLHHNCQ